MSELKIMFFTHKGEVMVVFNEAYNNLHLSPILARDIAAKLIAEADRIDAEQAAERAAAEAAGDAKQFAEAQPPPKVN